MTDGRVVTQVEDAEGGLVQVTLAAPRVTVGYERKVSGTAYGFPSEYDNAVASCHVQADVALDGSDRASAITEAFQFAKGAVLAQLQIGSTTNDDTGVVIESLVKNLGGTVQGSAPTPKRGSTGTAGPKKDTATLWAELESDPGKFFDNRADKASGKANAKGPDFKRKGTGEGLWILDKDGTNTPENLGVTLPA